VQRGSFSQGAIVDLRDAIAKGLVLVPRDQQWWMEFAIVTASVGTVVGWATFGCAIVATPGGPVLVALASSACAVVAAQGGTELVKVSYKRFTGRPLNESAMKAGTIAGTMLGLTLGSAGASQFINWRQFRHFKDFGGYASEARSLTRQSLSPVKAQTEALRAKSHDIDHVIPVKCGWILRIPPNVIGSLSNLQGLPASVNRSIGSKGC
jgi:hypothetical protein